VGAVFSVELEPGRLVDGDERPSPQPQLRLVGLDDVERRKAMAPLVFDERAVRAVERPRQGPE
jgi:hypothetical protein